MSVNEYFVPVRPLKVVHTREFVITNDGETVAIIQQDLYDKFRNIVADKYRVITEDNDLKGMLKDGAHNFPEEIKILEDEKKVVAECSEFVSIQINAYGAVWVVVYPRFDWNSLENKLNQS